MATMREVYERFGRTAETAQMYECGLATVWLYLEWISKGHWQSRPGPDEIKEISKVMGKTMLGKMLARVNKLMRSDDSDLEETLQRGVTVRNTLIHGFFDDRTKLSDPFGRQQKLNELDQIDEYLGKAVEITLRIAQSLCELHSQLRDPPAPGRYNNASK